MSDKYSFVNEHDDHFVISHPSEGKFKVAKKGINKVLQKKIKGLPKAMDDGGEVEASPDQSYIPDEYISDSVVPPGSYTEQPAEEPKSSGNPWGPIEGYKGLAAHLPSVGIGAMGNPQLTVAPGNQDIKKASMTAIPLDEKESQEVRSQMPAQEVPQQPQTAQPDYMGGVQNNIDTQASAMLKIGKAQQDMQNQIAAAEKHHQDVITTNSQQLKNDLDAQNLEYESLQKSYLDGKIDPKRLFHNMPTENKILAAISLFLGGMGAALTGGPNQALGIINKSIEQDIDAQKADLGKKESLLSMNLRKTGDYKSAYQMTMVQENALAEAKLREIGATANSQIAKQQSIIGASQLRAQSGQMMQGIAQQRLMRDIETGNKEVSPEMVGVLPPDMQKKAVTIPGQKMADGRFMPAKVVLANSDEDAKKAKESIQAHQELRSAITEARQFQEEVGSTYGVPGFRSDKDYMSNQLQTKLQVAWAKINGVGRETPPEEKEKLFKDIPAIGSFDQKKVSNALDMLERSGDQKRDSYLVTYAPKYNGSKVRQLETKGKVK